jgi:hypothetical protein
VAASAVVDNNCVMVYCTQVKSPIAVRYSLADNPAATLFNNSGLPVSPFLITLTHLNNTDK